MDSGHPATGPLRRLLSAGTPVALYGVVEKPRPTATFLGKYRLDRLVVADDDVTLWEATDVARGRSVRLSVFERGGAVVQQGEVEGSTFVVVGAAPSTARLELALATDEDDEDAEPPSPRRAWPWAAAALTCALVGFSGWYVAHARSQPTSETTITAAQIPAPLMTTTTTSEPPPKPPETPIVQSRHREAPAAPPAHKQVKPRQKPPAKSYDPLTI